MAQATPVRRAAPRIERRAGVTKARSIRRSSHSDAGTIATRAAGMIRRSVWRIFLTSSPQPEISSSSSASGAKKRRAGRGRIAKPPMKPKIRINGLVPRRLWPKTPQPLRKCSHGVWREATAMKPPMVEWRSGTSARGSSSSSSSSVAPRTHFHFLGNRRRACPASTSPNGTATISDPGQTRNVNPNSRSRSSVAGRGRSSR